MKHIIIGGGISGLYIGYQLYKRNEDFIILEKNKSEDRGRLYSINSNNIEKLKFSGERVPTNTDFTDNNLNDFFIMEMGASIIHSNQKNIMNLIKELKLEKSLVPLSNKTKTYFFYPKIKNKDAKEIWKQLKQYLFSTLSHLPPNYTLEDAAKTIFTEDQYKLFKSGVMEWYEVNLQNARIYKKALLEEGQYYSFSNGIEEIVKVLTKILRKYIRFGYEVSSIEKYHDTKTGALNSNYIVSFKSSNEKIKQLYCNKVYLCTNYTAAKNYINYYNLDSVVNYLNLGFDRCCYRFYVYFNRPLNIEYGYIYGEFELKWSIRINPQLWMITYVDGPLSCNLNKLKPLTLIKKWILFVNSLFNEKLSLKNVVHYQGAFWKDAYTVLTKKFYNLINQDSSSSIKKDKYGLSTPRNNKYYGEIIREQIPSSFICTVLPKNLGEDTAWTEGHLFNLEDM